jgi:hypothetical protein
MLEEGGEGEGEGEEEQQEGKQDRIVRMLN